VPIVRIYLDGFILLLVAMLLLGWIIGWTVDFFWGSN